MTQIGILLSQLKDYLDVRISGKHQVIAEPSAPAALNQEEGHPDFEYRYLNGLRLVVPNSPLFRRLPIRSDKTKAATAYWSRHRQELYLDWKQRDKQSFYDELKNSKLSYGKIFVRSRNKI